MKKIIFAFLFVGCILLDSVVTTIPLTGILIICATAIWKETYLLVLTFIAGIIIDMHTVRPIGQTSLFFTTVLAGMLLYERKYEIASLPFLAITSFLSVSLYAVIFSYQMPLLQGLLSIPASIIFYLLLSKSWKKRTKTY